MNDILAGEDIIINVYEGEAVKMWIEMGGK